VIRNRPLEAALHALGDQSLLESNRRNRPLEAALHALGDQSLLETVQAL
jgi:hypothetical protein